MKKIISIFLLVCFYQLAAAGIDTRKKNLEKRIRITADIVKVFPENGMAELQTSLLDKLKSVEQEYRSGTSASVSHSLVQAENELFLSEKKIMEYTETKADRILQYLDQPVPPASALSAKSREKITSYERMARKERILSAKYSREKQYYYALLILKRSIRYSLSAMQERGEPIPTDFSKAAVWMQKK